MAKFQKIIILENLPNAVSYVAHEIDKNGKDRYYYHHLDWQEPYRNGINKDDEFFLIDRYQVDEPGIVMHGFFDSDLTSYPLRWTNKRVYKIYLRDIQPIDPKKYRLLTIASLQAVMPGQFWDLIKSGWILNGPAILKIKEMWKMYLEMNDDFISNSDHS